MILRDIILVAVVLGVMALGFLGMRGLDRFLTKNEKPAKGQEAREENVPCVILTTEMTDEEIIRRIRDYEKKYGHSHMCVYQRDYEK